MRRSLLGAVSLLAVLLAHAVPVAAQFVASMSELYRYRDQETGARLYTIDRAEIARDDPRWALEGIAGYVFGLQELQSVPLYRFYDPETGDRIYTRAAELDDELAEAYRAEGIAGYVFDQEVTGTVPFYAYRSLQTGQHFYTTRRADLGNAAEQWKSEGMIAYIYPATEPLPRTPSHSPARPIR